MACTSRRVAGIKRTTKKHAVSNSQGSRRQYSQLRKKMNWKPAPGQQAIMLTGPEGDVLFDIDLIRGNGWLDMPLKSVIKTLGVGLNTFKRWCRAAGITDWRKAREACSTGQPA